MTEKYIIRPKGKLEFAIKVGWLDAEDCKKWACVYFIPTITTYITKEDYRSVVFPFLFWWIAIRWKFKGRK